MNHSRYKGLVFFFIGVAIEADISVDDGHGDVDTRLNLIGVNVFGLLEFLNAFLEIFLPLHLGHPVREKQVVAGALI